MGLHSLALAKSGVRVFPQTIKNQFFKFSTSIFKLQEAKQDTKQDAKQDAKPDPKADAKQDAKESPEDAKDSKNSKNAEDVCKEPEPESTFESLSGGKGLIVLNRPKQLNTLNTTMVRGIRQTLLKWKEEKYFIYIKGAGEKAFCAGGDVVAITKDESGSVGKTFFKEEYKLDAMIASFKIPVASLISGIVMGGGVGISLFGRYRIATETSMFAMPETQIGFFPDVGVTYHLARMPKNLGNFLALTGYRLKGYDLVHAGIATHFMNTSDIKEFENSLLYDFTKSLSSNPEDILKEFHEKASKSPPKFTLEEHLDSIEKWFSGCTAEEVLSTISSDKSQFAAETAECLKKMSPLSLKVTLKQMKAAKKAEIADCFNTDYRIAMKMLPCGDFREGVRALLIDKDKKPKWKHESLEKVTPEEVDVFFAPLPPEDELGLPKTLECD